jgi:hypothetical protein
MLAWKWWRDCRGRVLLYFVAALAIGIFAALDATSFNWFAERFRDDPQRLRFYVFLTWTRVEYNLSSPAMFGSVWIGVALAISSFGKDYASPATAFLLTRPRRRLVMLWTEWLMALLTIVVAAGCLLGSASLVAARGLPYLDARGLWAMFPSMIALAITVYGLTLFWTAATRSAVKGVELSIATMLIASLAPGALLSWWHIAWADRVQSWMVRIFDWRPVYSYWINNAFRTPWNHVGRGYYNNPVMYRSVEPYPLGALAIWIGLGLALAYATQKIMERREV